MENYNTENYNMIEVRLSMKISLFPVQWPGEIFLLSEPAGISFFFSYNSKIENGTIANLSDYMTNIKCLLKSHLITL